MNQQRNPFIVKYNTSRPLYCVTQYTPYAKTTRWFAVESITSAQFVTKRSRHRYASNNNLPVSFHIQNSDKKLSMTKICNKPNLWRRIANMINMLNHMGKYIKYTLVTSAGSQYSVHVLSVMCSVTHTTQTKKLFPFCWCSRAMRHACRNRYCRSNCRRNTGENLNVLGFLNYKQSVQLKFYHIWVICICQNWFMTWPGIILHCSKVPSQVLNQCISNTRATNQTREMKWKYSY